jgi:hypothetical protein
MSTISAADTSANSAIASMIKGAASSGAATASQGNTSSSSAPSASSTDPTDTVDLSDRAKEFLARAKSEQLAADKLNTLLQSLKNPDGNDATSKAEADEGTSLFDKLSGRAQTQTSSDTQWVAGAPYGDASISDADWTKKMKAGLEQQADQMDAVGLPPEAGQALRNAVANGTLKFQKASEVPDLNFHSQATFTKNAFGTIDSFISHSYHPAGATKDAIDQGKALPMWSADRGDIYITW